MPDEEMTEQGPLGSRQQFDEGEFDFFGGFFTREAESQGEARDMRVHHDAVVKAKGVAEDDVGGFAADAVEGDELLKGLRDFPAVEFEELVAGGLDIAGFVAVEADAFYFRFKNGRVGVGVIGGGAIFLEKGCGDDIDLFVVTLGGKDGGDEQFERVAIVEFAMGVGISLFQGGEDFFEADFLLVASSRLQVFSFNTIYQR